MTNTAAAIWSAIAASFAAISSLLIMLIQRRNLLEAVRPELVLTGWSRATRGAGNGEHQVISFRTIRNVGRGAAFHVHFQLMQETAGRPTAIFSTTRLPIIAPSESVDVNGEIVVWWKNVEPRDGSRYLHLTIPIFHLDSRGMRHETQYRLFVVEPPAIIFGTHELAAGVALGTRNTITRPLWLLRLGLRLRQLPGVRWVLRKVKKP